MTVVSLHQSHEKSTLGWQKENGSKGIITIESHSITNDISSYVWHLKETLDVTPNLKWSVVRCATPYSNISKKSFVFV